MSEKNALSELDELTQSNSSSSSEQDDTSIIVESNQDEPLEEEVLEEEVLEEEVLEEEALEEELDDSPKKFDINNLETSQKAGLLILLIIAVVFIASMMLGDDDGIVTAENAAVESSELVSSVDATSDGNKEVIDAVDFGSLDEVQTFKEVAQQSININETEIDEEAEAKKALINAREDESQQTRNEIDALKADLQLLTESYVTAIDELSVLKDEMKKTNNILAEMVMAQDQKIEKNLKQIELGKVNENANKPEIMVMRIISGGNCMNCRNQALVKNIKNDSTAIFSDGDTVLGRLEVSIEGKRLILSNDNEQYTYNAY